MHARTIDGKHLQTVRYLHTNDHDVGNRGTVPGELVHKIAAPAVLLRGAQPQEEVRFNVTTNWPTAGPLFRYDAQGAPVLLSEVMRQVAIYLSHCFYGVPLDHQFILSELDLELQDPPGCTTLAQTAQAEAVVRVEARSARRLSARLDMAVRHDGRLVGSGAVRWLAVDPAGYTRLRSRHPGVGEPFPGPGRARDRLLAPQSVGCRAEEDVLLAAAPEDGTAWELVLDTGNRWHFDHPLDHVPGVAVVEAFRQAGHAFLHRPQAKDAIVLSSCSLSFHAFASLTSPLTVGISQCAKDGLGRKAVELTASQCGSVIASGRATWAAQESGGTRGRPLQPVGAPPVPGG